MRIHPCRISLHIRANRSGGARETLTATATVRNLVSNTDGGTVSLTIDGTPVNQTVLSLTRGATRQVELQYTVPATDLGTHRVGIETNADATSKTVDAVATLSGTITDPSGLVGGATVSVVGTSTQTTTRSDGSYTLANLDRKSVDLHVTWTDPSGATVTKTDTVTMNGDTVENISLVPSLADLPGTGFSYDPYVISSVRDLVAVRQNPFASYVLGTDVDAAEGELRDLTRAHIDSVGINVGAIYRF